MHLPPRLSKILKLQAGRSTPLEMRVELQVVVLQGQRDDLKVLGLMLRVQIQHPIVLQLFVNIGQEINQ